jgi:acetylornithine deacetylase/succinyl-diaminopimelate desuccinylase-like protein
VPCIASDGGWRQVLTAHTLSDQRSEELPVERVVAFLHERRRQHFDDVVSLCRIPSISTRPEHKADVAAAVKWTADKCSAIGLEPRIFETARHPLVYAEWLGAPGAPTYLVYGHVDVQPTGDLKLWDAGPFEPTVKGEWLVCRGSADDKGQVLLYLRAAEAWLAAEKKLPVNLKLLIEGEEEIGSPNLPGFIEQHRHLLRCDHILISDTGMYEDGWPTITYGTRGLVYKEIKLSGPKHDLHSGTHGGGVGNPATVVAEIIASLHDGDGRVTIPGFYEQVVNPSAEERRLAASLPFDEQRYLHELGSPAACGEKGYSTYERRTSRPTLEVNGIYGGYMGEGANTIIPARAGAKISMRLVPDQSGAAISRAFDETVRARCPSTVRLEILQHGECDAYMAPLDSKPMQAARRAMKEAFEREPAFIREGGSLPILPMFKRVLGADSLMLGFASPACNAHGPNEKVRVPDLDRGAEAIARVLEYLR